MPYPSIGYRVAAEIAKATGMETRVTVLGYLQRGGVPSAYDRVLSTAFGSAAAELAFSRRFGRMVAWRDGARIDSRWTRSREGPNGFRWTTNSSASRGSWGPVSARNSCPRR